MNLVLEINRSKIAANVLRMVSLCASHGIEITGITKVFRGDPEITRLYTENGIRRIGDSRIDNLKKNAHLSCEKWLVRMPAPQEAPEVAEYADVSLESEIATLRALEAACQSLGKTHKVVLMYDLGDLREGFLTEAELMEAADFVKESPHLTLYGVGTNLTCFSFIQPDTEKLSLLVSLSQKIGAGTVISGGNSATLDLMLRDGIPEGVNLLRLGESLLFGRERARYQYLPGTENDAFILKIPVIECRDKPSLPWGTVGVDSYGRSPVFEDLGIRKRAICEAGRQDLDPETMWPLDPGIRIIGASSDHLMLDVTDAAREYVPGDTISFRLGYFALMRAYTSDYVRKQYL